MSTNNKIIIKEIPNTIFIPQEAVFEKDNKHFVFVKNSSSFDEQFIEVGDKSEDYIIVKKGLKPGDVVALKNPDENKKDNISKTSNTQIDLPSNGN
jgi:HlyD family secretion protein